MAGHSPPRVLIMGHSYVRRLREFCFANGQVNLGILPSDAQVILHGFGGMRLRGLVGRIHMVRDLSPSVVVLQIGGNDLSSAHHASPHLVARQILDFCQTLLDSGVVSVMVCKLFPRLTCRPGYNADVQLVNSILEHCLNNRGLISGAHFWYHNHGLGLTNPLLYHRDGVHLSQGGLQKYYGSVRGAVLHGLNAFA